MHFSRHHEMTAGPTELREFSGQRRMRVETSEQSQMVTEDILILVLKNKRASV